MKPEVEEAVLLLLPDAVQEIAILLSGVARLHDLQMLKLSFAVMLQASQIPAKTTCVSSSFMDNCVLFVKSSVN